jgi:hypothetical protein
MTPAWLHNPYLNLSEVATRLYGSHSRMYTQRLRKKMAKALPFEEWEIYELEKIKQDIICHIQHGHPVQDMVAK